MAKKKKHPLSGIESNLPTACILPSLLYLPPVSEASNAAFLAGNRITHVLSIGRSPSAYIEGIIYERLALKDEEDAPLRGVVEKACEFIDDAAASSNSEGKEKGKGAVLVHCSAAISRSPAVVAGYLMKRRGMKLRESLELLVSVRGVVSPSLRFLRQLSEIEKEIFEEEGTFDAEAEGVKRGRRLGWYLGM